MAQVVESNVVFPVEGANVENAIVQAFYTRDQIILIRTFSYIRCVFQQFPRMNIINRETIFTPVWKGNHIISYHDKIRRENPDQIHREFLPPLKAIPGKVGKHLFRAVILFLPTRKKR